MKNFTEVEASKVDSWDVKGNLNMRTIFSVPDSTAASAGYLRRL